jgi:hypothetical protein
VRSSPFAGGRGDRIKLLYWDDHGFRLYLHGAHSSTCGSARWERPLQWKGVRLSWAQDPRVRYGKNEAAAPSAEFGVGGADFIG